MSVSQFCFASTTCQLQPWIPSSCHAHARLAYTSRIEVLHAVICLVKIFWLVDRKVHDTDSSIQSVVVAFDLTDFVFMCSSERSPIILMSRMPPDSARDSSETLFSEIASRDCRFSF